MAVRDAPGAFLGDEIQQSGDPTRHADDLIATIRRHGLAWVALELAVSETGEVPAATRKAFRDLRDAASRRGGAVGGWGHRVPADTQIRFAIDEHADFWIPNVESNFDDRLWTDGQLDQLRTAMPHGVAVIFTEGAWGRDPVAAARWRTRGFDAIPEAIVSENPQATIGAMLELAQTLGWAPQRTAPTLYLTRGFEAARYTPTIHLTGGRWSLYRYGDIDADDWTAIDGWPKSPPPGEPDPEPEPIPPALPMMTVMEGHANTRHGVQAVRNKLAAAPVPTKLGRTASLTSQDRLALGAVDGTHGRGDNAKQIADLLDRLGYPTV